MGRFKDNIDQVDMMWQFQKKISEMSLDDVISEYKIDYNLARQVRRKSRNKVNALSPKQKSLLEKYFSHAYSKGYAAHGTTLAAGGGQLPLSRDTALKMAQGLLQFHLDNNESIRLLQVGILI